ncbi:RPII140-upstream gene protein-like [Pecten maximus]|uniref:RPII140-upstream gene protein-like n=1 Tax=Pecten maximus TaxID=6579 RepID=UPI001458BE40|nr:RPII140-upstream gene protein-like [Pecten maximus]XP_033744741.1 RPII140-upstream gene protein-like [Pecten maximus]
MDPFRMNSKETFQLKPFKVFHPSQYSLSAHRSTKQLLKFPYINTCTSKPACSAVSGNCKNDHAASSRTVVRLSDKKSTPLSYSVYQRLRSCIQVPVLLAETKTDEVADVETPIDTPFVSREEVLEYIANETGEERLQDFYYKNDQGKRHPQYDEITVDFIAAVLLGACVGFPLGFRTTSIKFTEENRATIFRSKMSYERMRIDKSLLGGMKMAMKGGFHSGTFMTLILVLSKCIAIYRNKTSVVEYSVAASVAGALYRAHMGAKGMTAGGMVGFTLGTVAGILTMGLAKATGETQQNKHYRYIEEKLILKKSSGAVQNV